MSALPCRFLPEVLDADPHEQPTSPRASPLRSSLRPASGRKRRPDSSSVSPSRTRTNPGPRVRSHAWNPISRTVRRIPRCVVWRGPIFVLRLFGATPWGRIVRRLLPACRMVSFIQGSRRRGDEPNYGCHINSWLYLPLALEPHGRSLYLEARVQIVEQFLLERVVHASIDNKMTSAANYIFRCHGTIKISSLANRYSLGVRQFERAFERETEISPKSSRASPGSRPLSTPR